MPPPPSPVGGVLGCRLDCLPPPHSLYEVGPHFYCWVILYRYRGGRGVPGGVPGFCFSMPVGGGWHNSSPSPPPPTPPPSPSGTEHYRDQRGGTCSPQPPLFVGGVLSHRRTQCGGRPVASPPPPFPSQGNLQWGGTPIAPRTKLTPAPQCLLPTAPLGVGGSFCVPPRPVLEQPPPILGPLGGGQSVTLHPGVPPRGSSSPPPPLFIPLRLHLPAAIPPSPPPPPVPELPPPRGGPRSHVYSPPHPGGGRGFSIFAK